MLVYFVWNQDGMYSMAFSKPESAIDFILNKIEAMVGLKPKHNDWISPKKKKKPAIFTRLEQPLVFAPPDEPRVVPAPPPQPYLQAAAPQPYFQDIQFDDLNQQFNPNAPDPEYPAIPPPVDNRLYQGLVNQLGQSLVEYHSQPVAQHVKLDAIKDQIKLTTETKSIDNIRSLMKLYDEYSQEMFGFVVPIHTLEDIRIADEHIQS